MGSKKIKKNAELMKDLEDFKKSIKKKFFVEKMLLFGSAATGNMTEHSDIDLLIVSRKFGKKQFFKIVPKLYSEWNLGYPVDFLCYNKEEFEQERKKVSIVSEAVREGIEI